MSKTKIVLLVCSLQFLLLNTINAQSENPDFMRSIGKIYVVVAVIVAIFIGIILFLISIERKIKRLEEQMEH